MFDEELVKHIKFLEKYERKLSSLWWNFWRGIVYGLGFFIGSALLAAVIIYIMSKISGWAYIGHYVHEIIQIVNKNQT
jgi:hypothetical protein